MKHDFGVSIWSKKTELTVLNMSSSPPGVRKERVFGWWLQEGKNCHGCWFLGVVLKSEDSFKCFFPIVRGRGVKRKERVV